MRPLSAKPAKQLSVVGGSRCVSDGTDTAVVESSTARASGPHETARHVTSDSRLQLSIQVRLYRRGASAGGAGVEDARYPTLQSTINVFPNQGPNKCVLLRDSMAKSALHSLPLTVRNELFRWRDRIAHHVVGSCCGARFAATHVTGRPAVPCAHWGALIPCVCYLEQVGAVIALHLELVHARLCEPARKRGLAFDNLVSFLARSVDHMTVHWCVVVVRRQDPMHDAKRLALEQLARFLADQRAVVLARLVVRQRVRRRRRELCRGAIPDLALDRQRLPVLWRRRDGCNG
eukprot:36187-Rhodomonas_salina.1